MLHRSANLPGYSVAEWLGISGYSDHQVVGSNPGRRAAGCNPGQVVYKHVPQLPTVLVPECLQQEMSVVENWLFLNTRKTTREKVVGK